MSSEYNGDRRISHVIMNNYIFGFLKVCVCDVEEGSYEICIYHKDG